MESIWKNKKKNNNNNKRRFNDEQIRLLESMFQAESRPELQIKQRLANELGLQPRQVAIWFQNKRARSKSKLIQQDYNMLKSSYDALASKFDSLKKENQCLLFQLKTLRKLMVEPQSSRNHEVGQAEESIDQGLDNVDRDCSEGEEKTNLVLDCDRHETQMPLSDETRENTEFGEENQYMKMEELLPDGSLTSSANWWSFESSCALDHPSCNSPCWEI